MGTNYEGDVKILGFKADPDGEGSGVDPTTEALVLIDYTSHKINEGKLFSAHYHQSVTGTGKETAIAFNTPADEDIYLDISADSSQDAVFYLCEAPSITVDQGTQLAVLNKNRNSPNELAITSVETTPVANKTTSYNATQAAGAGISKTTVLYQKNFALYAFEKKQNVDPVMGDFILKRDTQYVAVINASIATVMKHSIRLNFYAVP